MNDTTSVDSLLDAELDDLSDLPEFAVYPNGVHRVQIFFESKEVNKHPAVELKMKMLETIELADPTKDSPVAAGAEGNVLYMLDNEFGQGKFKEIAKVLAAATGISKLGELIKAANGMEVIIVNKVRSNKDKSQNYNDISKMEVA